jgi:hypothetical protein
MRSRTVSERHSKNMPHNCETFCFRLHRHIFASFHRRILPCATDPAAMQVDQIYTKLFSILPGPGNSNFACGRVYSSDKLMASG